MIRYGARFVSLILSNDNPISTKVCVPLFTKIATCTPRPKAQELLLWLG